MESQCHICSNSYQACLLQKCLVTPSSSETTGCQQITCLNCVIMMCIKNQRCGCGGQWTNNLLGQIKIDGAPVEITVRTIRDEDQFVRFSNSSTFRRRCSCFGRSTNMEVLWGNILYWLRTFLSFAMGATLLPLIYSIMNLFRATILITQWPLLDHAGFLFLVGITVWPVVRFSHKLFRDDKRAILWALALLMFTK